MTDFPCDAVFENFSTRRNPDGSEITRFVDRLLDPLTNLAFQGDACPTSFAEIVDIMKANEPDCGDGAPRLEMPRIPRRSNIDV